MKRIFVAISAILTMSSALAIDQKEMDLCEIYKQFANDVMIVR